MDTEASVKLSDLMKRSWIMAKLVGTIRAKSKSRGREKGKDR